MPTYNALGVSATLSVAPLEHTISETTGLRIGRLQRQEELRIGRNFDNGRSLRERTIGDSSSNGSVMHFVGEHEDMALFVVEASDEDSQSARSQGWTGPIAVPAPANAAIKSSGGLQSIAMDEQGNLEMPFTCNPRITSGNTASDDAAVATPVDHYAIRPMMQQQPPPLAQADGQLALCLAVECSTKTFLREFGKKPETGKDLKFEIFLNGELVEVAYEPARHASKPGSQRFAGTRIHRQSEKPWGYEGKRLTTDTKVSQAEAGARWKGVQAALIEEAKLRGRDWADEPPVSTKFLTALGEMELPENIRAKGAGLGVIDIMIIAGTGHRYGANTTYSTAPTRMDDPGYSAFAALGLSNPAHESRSPQPVPSTPVKQMNNTERVRMPNLTPQGPKTIHTPAARTPHFQSVVDDSELQFVLERYENAHGQRKGSRSLRQRIGDIRKMSPKKQQATLAELGENLSDGQMQTIRRALNIEAVSISSPSLLNPMMSPPALYTEADPDAMDISPYPAADTFDPSTLTIDPSDLFLGPGPQKPIFASNVRRTKASALANSPISLPPKKQTPKKRLVNNSSSPIRDRAGQRRTADCWDPAEQTVTEALQRFEIPDLCIGSSVGYSRGLEQRQISRVRGGEFKEETFLVGMRFIVL